MIWNPVNAGFLNYMTNYCKYILLTFSVLLNKFIKMFIDISKHNGDPGINSGLPTLANSSGKLRENILIVRSVHNACVCHGPVPVVKKTLFLRIYTYLLIGSCFCSLDSLHRNVIRPVVIIDVLHLYVAKFWKRNFTGAANHVVTSVKQVEELGSRRCAFPYTDITNCCPVSFIY